MTDEEALEQARACKRWYQRSPWKEVIYTVLGAGLVSLIGWAVGAIPDVVSAAQAAEQVDDNTREIQQVKTRLQGLESGQRQILNRLGEIRADIRRQQ